MYPKGIDVSKWDNSTLSFPAHNWDFIYIKVSEGLIKDVMFDAHWQACKTFIKRGAYHYFRPDVDPKQSALKTVEFMDDLGELPLALDLETTKGRSDTLERAKTWLSWYEDKTGVRPIIYSGIPFLTEIGARGKSWLSNYDFWYAAYPYDNLPLDEREQKITDILRGYSVLNFPKIDLFPPMNLVIYQWTSRAKPELIAGYNGDKKAVDVNFARPEWLSKFGSVPSKNILVASLGDKRAEYKEV